MNHPYSALVIPARLGHPVHIRPVEIDLPAITRVAAGDIGLITGNDWRVYLNNTGTQSSPNVRAEVLIREAGIDLDATIHGTAMFLGQGSRGEETDAPRHLIRLAEQLCEMQLAA
jgi:hypothetical protein